ncbi:MAG: hypothetical protein DME22_08595 [Verrucomicrobia bacterium]|nr:MAG: hypothetical protein DME22_08595 [Verrucomicrobiota bacterium]
MISGEQEAEWVFWGVTTDSPVAGHPLLVLKVGGGSTEFILGERGFIHFRRSFPLGTVRLLEILRPSDPPSADDLVRCRRWLKEFFCRAVRPKLQPPLGSFCGRTLKLVGTGGAAATLARLHVGMIGQAAEPLSAHPLTAQQVSAQVERLWALPLAQRVKLVGLSAQKADVILPGAAIFEALMEDFAFDELAVSTNGMRYGALIDSAEALGHRASLGCAGQEPKLWTHINCKLPSERRRSRSPQTSECSNRRARWPLLQRTGHGKPRPASSRRRNRPSERRPLFAKRRHKPTRRPSPWRNSPAGP